LTIDSGETLANEEHAQSEEERKAARKDANNRAIRLLARREHSAKEIRDALTAKGIDAALLEPLLAQLQSDGLQSDRRFAEAYGRYRQQRGFGPLRIKQELIQKGIEAELINEVLNNSETPWEKSIEMVRAKRFGNAMPSDPSNIAKQMRFLNYRGFPAELVHWLMKHGKDEVE